MIGCNHNKGKAHANAPSPRPKTLQRIHDALQQSELTTADLALTLRKPLTLTRVWLAHARKAGIAETSGTVSHPTHKGARFKVWRTTQRAKPVLAPQGPS